MKNKIICNDCLKELKSMEDNSVDAIVTDPPYGLSFMGKKWDYDVPSIEIWQECLRVLKPGGYLLSFAGTRTQHRMACNIEDAGFEIRDMIAWVYGCLSEDTEILTEKGYKPLHKTTQYDRIMVYDVQKDIYQWERPQGWQVYRVNEDTAYRIQSDYTDQIVSRNHRCLVEQGGSLTFKKAEDLSEMEHVPDLSEDFYTLQTGCGKLLFEKLLWKSKDLAQKVFSKWKGNQEPEERTKDGKEPRLERWSNLFQKKGKLWKIQNKVCEVSKGVSADGEERWVCNGTSFDSGSIVGEMLKENPSSASYQSQPRGQQVGKSDVVSIKQGTQNTRVARVTKIKYSGLIYCPTVSTGAFIARRNGKVFITGNSGFPKSHNIGKAVDKLQGNEREKTGVIKYHAQKGVAIAEERGAIGGGAFGQAKEEEVTKGNSEWEGWGTALKPALEPITVARKPFKGTVANNVLKYGTGGINIDECRVGETGAKTNSNGKRSMYGGNSLLESKTHNTTTTEHNYGRFPANLIHDGSDEVVELFPNSRGSGKARKLSRSAKPEQQGWGMNKNKPDAVELKDAGDGSASRFFKTCNDTPKRAILKVCINNSNVKIAEKDLATMSLTEQVVSMFSALKNVTHNSDLLNQNLTVLSAEKNAKSTEISFVQNLVATLIDGRMELTGEMKQMELWLKSLTQEQLLNILIELNNLAWFAEKDINILKDTIQNIVNLKLLYGYVEVATLNSTLARFKYQSKASKKERNMGCDEIGGNRHCTVKPLKLMQYLVRLVTPKNGTVLDPFMGSGTTGIACKKEGFNFIGIEREEEYCKIAQARIDSIKGNLFNG